MQTDAGMCGDYNSVIGMNKENSLKDYFKEDSKNHFQNLGEPQVYLASLLIVLIKKLV